MDTTYYVELNILRDRIFIALLYHMLHNLILPELFTKYTLKILTNSRVIPFKLCIRCLFCLPAFLTNISSIVGVT